MRRIGARILSMRCFLLLSIGLLLAPSAGAEDETALPPPPPPAAGAKNEFDTLLTDPKVAEPPAPAPPLDEPPTAPLIPPLTAPPSASETVPAPVPAAKADKSAEDKAAADLATAERAAAEKAAADKAAAEKVEADKIASEKAAKAKAKEAEALGLPAETPVPTDAKRDEKPAPEPTPAPTESEAPPPAPVEATKQPEPRPEPAQVSAEPNREAESRASRHIPFYQTIKPQWALEFSGSLKALGGHEVNDSQGGHKALAKAAELHIGFQPAIFQSMGVLDIGPTLGGYFFDAGAGVTENVLGLWSVGGEVRYQFRYFREQILVPMVGYASEFVTYRYSSGTHGNLTAAGPVIGLWLLMNVFEPRQSAELYLNTGVARSYAVVEFRFLSGDNDDIVISDGSLFFGLRIEL